MTNLVEQLKYQNVRKVIEYFLIFSAYCMNKKCDTNLLILLEIHELSFFCLCQVLIL